MFSNKSLKNSLVCIFNPLEFILVDIHQLLPSSCFSCTVISPRITITLKLPLGHFERGVLFHWPNLFPLVDDYGSLGFPLKLAFTTLSSRRVSCCSIFLPAIAPPVSFSYWAHSLSHLIVYIFFSCLWVIFIIYIFH